MPAVGGDWLTVFVGLEPSRRGVVCPSVSVADRGEGSGGVQGWLADQPEDWSNPGGEASQTVVV